MMLGSGANGALVRRARRFAGLLACLVFSVLAQTTFAQQRQPTSYDLVLTGGRVMDPESGLDAVRNGKPSEAISTSGFATARSATSSGIMCMITRPPFRRYS